MVPVHMACVQGQPAGLLCAVRRSPPRSRPMQLGKQFSVHMQATQLAARQAKTALQSSKAPHKQPMVNADRNHMIPKAREPLTCGARSWLPGRHTALQTALD